jgi:hypothetical protein
MKRLLVCLLLVGVVGCGETQQVAQTPDDGEIHQEKISTSVQSNTKLVSCPDCGDTVSKRATECPHCGAPFLAQEFNSLMYKSGGVPHYFLSNDFVAGSAGSRLAIMYSGWDLLTDQDLVQLERIAFAADLDVDTPDLLAYVSLIQLDGGGLTDLGIRSFSRMLRRSRRTGAEAPEGFQRAPLSINITGTSKITDAGLIELARIPNVRYLRVHSPNITDAGLAHFKRRQDIKELDIGSPNITDAGVAELQKALPDCEITH